MGHCRLLEGCKPRSWRGLPCVRGRRDLGGPLTGVGGRSTDHALEGRLRPWICKLEFVPPGRRFGRFLCALSNAKPGTDVMMLPPLPTQFSLCASAVHRASTAQHGSVGRWRSCSSVPRCGWLRPAAESQPGNRGVRAEQGRGSSRRHFMDALPLHTEHDDEFTTRSTTFAPAPNCP